MSKHFSNRILEYLQQPGYEPVKTHRLAHAMGIAEAEQGDFRDAVDALRRVGRVVIGTDNAITLPRTPGEVVGTYRGNPRGFGFVVPDEPTAHGDLYIPEGKSLGAITGDTVQCRVMNRGKRSGKFALGGQVIKIMERGHSRFVGELCKEGDLWYVQPDGNVLHGPVMVGDIGAKSARRGDQVVVEIVKYPRTGQPARGVIVERLGKRGRPGVDLLGVIRQFHLPDAFSPEALDEAGAVVRSFNVDDVIASREDLSDRTIVTIDPDTARDFDDAISLVALKPSKKTPRPSQGKSARSRRRRGAGEAAWELGVHIADVSTFVPEGGELDADASERGTSVYFPGHVIPMLPEVLSNGLCSLQQGEPRLCKSAFIQYDAAGKVVGARIANTVIRSAKRLTYQQAQAILDGKGGRFRKTIVELVKRMDKLARLIRQRRLDDGMIVLDLREVELKFDDKERVIDAEPTDDSFTHTIIEMFMVEANEAVARLLRGLRAPFLRRIHPEPDEAAMEGVTKFLRAAGHALPKSPTQADVQALLARVKGRPESYAVNLAILKSMQQAEYSPRDIGHFALASDCYAHFTSPIRRYPDLIVHRLLQMYLDGLVRRGRMHSDVPYEAELVDWGRRLSYASRRAESAEREYRTLKILQLLSEHLGDTFKGIITSVTNFGLFVQHPKYLIEGLLRLENLGDDWWDVDVATGRIIGQRTRQVLAIGKVVTVQISEVNLSSRQLNLQFVSAAAPRGSSREKSGPAPVRRGRKGPAKGSRSIGRNQRSKRRR